MFYLALACFNSWLCSTCFASIRHKPLLLKSYLWNELYTMCQYNIQIVTAKRIWKSELIYSLHFSQFGSIGQAQNVSKQFPYKVIVGTGSICSSAKSSLYGSSGK